MSLTPLVIGIGSYHGDDQVGWFVAQQLARRLRDKADVRQALSPMDILNWIEGARRLLICDACRGSGEPGTIRRWTWPAAELERLSWSGTHSLGLPETLALAEQLGHRLHQTIIWTVEADRAELNQPEPGQPLSHEVASAVLAVVEAIEDEINQGALSQPVANHA